MNYQELAQKVKSKYPGQYDDLDNKTLAQKIIAKHPEYSDTTFEPTLMDRAKKVASVSNKLFGYTAPGMLMKGANMAMGAIQKPFDVAGEKTAEFLGSKQVNPNISASVGATIQMVPNVAMSLLPAEEVSIAPKTAEGLASRALGNTKKFLGTTFARGKAQEAGQVALKEGVIPALGSPEVMMERAQALKSKTGSLLGQMRSAVGKQDISPVLTKLDDLGESLTGFSSKDIAQNLIDKGEPIGGIQGQTLKQIQFAKDTLNNLLIKGKEVDLNDVIKAKTNIGKTINWLSDNATQSNHKRIVQTIENSVKGILGGQGADLGKYNYLKKTYGASASMIKSLNNELSRGGNMPVSLPGTIVGAAELMRGNPMAALAETGVYETLKRRGAGMGASSLYKARIPVGASKALIDLTKRKK